VTGELHLRHHITPQGFYKGKPVAVKLDDEKDDE
jgi:ribosomal protein L32